MHRRTALGPVLVAAALVLPACSASAPASTLEPGDCVTAESLDTETQLGNVSAVACTEPHEFEVFAVPDAGSETFPGTEEVTALGHELCAAAFEDYVGAPLLESVHVYSFLHSGESDWNEGSRAITCLIPTETRSASVRGTGE